MDNKITIKEIWKLKIFQSLSLEELNYISPMIHEKKINTGDVIIKENEKTTDIYMIKEGSVDVKKRGFKNNEFLISSLGAGDVFGEMAFVDNQPRSSSVVASNPTVLFQFNVDLLSVDDPMGASILGKLHINFIQKLFSYMKELNKGTIQHLKNKITSVSQETEFGKFFVYAITFFSVYNLISVYIPLSSIISSPMQILELSCVLLFPAFAYMYHMSYTFKKLGVHFCDSGKMISQILAIILYGLITAVAVFNIYTGSVSPFYQEILQNIYDLASWTSIPLLIYAFSVELTMRGLIQNSLQKFLDDKSGVKSVFLIATFMISVNLYFGMDVAIATYTLNLLYGLTYIFQRNLLGVTLLRFFAITILRIYA
ncbi:cyclic nucleotide-binding domain-containing protein [Chlamydiales bacterium]|nr:cyclic nucleotide-binding domain-containing protein [Chlamydiales bacterium]